MNTGLLPPIVIVAALASAGTLGLSGEEQQAAAPQPAARPPQASTPSPEYRPAQQKAPQKQYAAPLDMDPPPLASDASVKYDYDIVYVRAPRTRPDGVSKWAEVGDPRRMEPGADLMLLHPDGSEEVLVPVKGNESIADPQVSFDGQWVYYAKMHDNLRPEGADIYKIHVPTRRVVRLTEQKFTPNTGVRNWKEPSWGVFNLGPCPLPGGKVAFVSDRNAFQAQNPGYTPNALALQLCVMDDDGRNVECFGHMNLGMALHPVMLMDGRLMFSTLESQGLRSPHLWGVWSIHPDGTAWGPLFSAFEIANGTADSTHFQTQLTDGRIVVQSYYNLNNFGFGVYLMFPPKPPDGEPAFGPGFKGDRRNLPVRFGRAANGRQVFYKFPFSPYGLESLTPFVPKGDVVSLPAAPGQKDSPRLGKFTHPSGAPDNHLLTAWSPGSVKDAKRFSPSFDSGIYLIKSGIPVEQPAGMRLVKNDPNYHEQWPRALVPYKRIYGIDEPARLPPHINDGSRSAHLPAGTPFGLIGSSSLYKRETYPYGAVKPGTVTAAYARDEDPRGDRGFDSSYNWTVQGADAGLYENSDIHAIRILHLEPTTDVPGPRTYYNHARERMRILGEIPVRKFDGDKQPVDPDGNPDTSFLAKIPANVAWTFQTLDKRGMVLNSSQTWHQIRPGEVRTNCGGCHAHSQKPTDFRRTAAGRKGYEPFDLTARVPLMTSRDGDQSGKKWDVKGETGLRFAEGAQTVEYFRDIKPILERSCVACHTEKDGRVPDGNLVLDDNSAATVKQPAGISFDLVVPGTYARLAADKVARWGYKPLHRNGWQGGDPTAASRYIRMMQARRSLLIWKIFGERLDGFQNDDLPYETIPGDPASLHYKGKPVPDSRKYRDMAHVGYTGGIMPPPEAVASGLVKPLSDEDRRTLVRWVDLGCPIDLTWDPVDKRYYADGWFFDDQRPTLALTYPLEGGNRSLDRVLIGLHDIGKGLDLSSLKVVADAELDGASAGSNLADRFRETAPGVWEWRFSRELTSLPVTTLKVSIADKQKNVTRLERTFSVGNNTMTRR